jgi:hypothetical protein
MIEIDTVLPTKLNVIGDAPEPFPGALRENISAENEVHLLLHAPSFATAREKTPATVLAVTNAG